MDSNTSETAVSQVPDFILNEQVETVFKKLDTMTVRLEKDPTVMGPSYVHAKLKECRDFSNDIEQMMVTFLDIERKVKNMLATEKESMRIQRSELIALDDWVLKGKSSSDREARVDIKLKDQAEVVADLQEQSINVLYVLRAVELKREGLNRVNNDIKKQVSLMEFAKTNSYPLMSDDIEEETSAKPAYTLDDSAEDMENLFGSLPLSEEPPQEISPKALRHMDNTSTIEEFENKDTDIDSFLTNLTIEETDFSSNQEVNSMDDEIDSTLFTFREPVDQKISKSFSVDEEVVDIGAFLSHS